MPATFAASSRASLQAVTFDGCYGTWHRPAAGRERGVGVVLVPPVGGEARRAYRPLWLLARELAGQGFSVLRYDHPGSADSAPIGEDADQWACWLAAVRNAAAFMRESCGAERLVLGGLRIGATLACAAAPKVRPDGLMLLAPVMSGAVWLRELRLAIGIAGGAAALGAGIELDGLRLTEATLKSLGEIKLRPGQALAPIAFVAERDPTSTRLAWVAEDAVQAPFDGYEAFFREAHVNEPPHEVFARAVSWASAAFPSTTNPPVIAPAPAPVLEGRDWRETPVAFGEGLRGVLCRPIVEAHAPAVIFCNTGGDPRAGVGDFATFACRRLAAAGVASLRFDFAGLGESDFAGEGWRSHPFEDSRIADLRAAADLLRSQGYAEVVLSGVCSGAYHALQAALSDHRFGRLFLVNPRLVWRPGARLTSEAASGEPPRRLRLRSLMSASAWRKLLSGKAPFGRALALLAQRIGGHLGLYWPWPEGRRVRRGLRRIGRQGARVAIVVGTNDEYLDELEANFGRGGRWLNRRAGVQVAFNPQVDHALFSEDSRTLVMNALLAFVRAPGAAGPLPRIIQTLAVLPGFAAVLAG